MGKSVALDKSQWSPDALKRDQQFSDEQAAHKARLALLRSHPLAGALDGVTDRSIAESAQDRYRVKLLDFGNGQQEAVVTRESPDLTRTLERAIQRDLGATGDPGQDREDNVERAVRRAKQKVRHLAKTMAVNALWTLTYRANVQERDLVLKHFQEFSRRVRSVLGDWRYIAVLERQERGAFHIHLATHALPYTLKSGGVKVKSWDVMRAIWRRITGQLGGNFDEAKRKKRFGQGAKTIKGPGAIARYLAGYVAKDMHESPENRKRYSHTVGIDIPAAHRQLWDVKDISFRELIERVYAWLRVPVTAAWCDAERGVFFVEAGVRDPLR